MSSKSTAINKIESLRSLAFNWNGYGALPVDGAVIDAAKTFVNDLPDDLEFSAHVAPMSNRRLQLEFDNGPKSLELEFISSDTISYLQWWPEENVQESNNFSVKDIETGTKLINWCMSPACAPENS